MEKIALIVWMAMTVALARPNGYGYSSAPAVSSAVVGYEHSPVTYTTVEDVTSARRDYLTGYDTSFTEPIIDVKSGFTHANFRTHSGHTEPIIRTVSSSVVPYHDRVVRVEEPYLVDVVRTESVSDYMTLPGSRSVYETMDGGFGEALVVRSNPY